jgi:IMP dehydrogenase/GMP reductase
MKILFAAATITAVLAISPASAAMMTCTSDNMAKSVAAGGAMPEGPGKMAMMKEMGMANTAMSKGDMRGACKSYMRAQKMGSKKS